MGNINTDDIRFCVNAGVPIVEEQKKRLNKKDEGVVNSEIPINPDDGGILYSEKETARDDKGDIFGHRPKAFFAPNASKITKRTHESLHFEFWIADCGHTLCIGLGPAKSGFQLGHFIPIDRRINLPVRSNSRLEVTDLEMFFMEFDDTMLPDENDTKNLCDIDLKNYNEYYKLKSLTQRSYNAIKQAFLAGEVVINGEPFPTNIPISTFLYENKYKSNTRRIEVILNTESKLTMQVPNIAISPNKERYQLTARKDVAAKEFDYRYNEDFHFVWTGRGVIRYDEIIELGVLSNPKDYEKIKQQVIGSQTDEQLLDFDTEELKTEESLDHSEPISKDIPMWDKSNEDTQAMPASQLLDAYSTELSDAQKQKEETERRLQNSNRVVIINIVFIIAVIVMMFILAIVKGYIQL